MSVVNAGTIFLYIVRHRSLLLLWYLDGFELISLNPTSLFLSFNCSKLSLNNFYVTDVNYESHSLVIRCGTC